MSDSALEAAHARVPMVKARRIIAEGRLHGLNHEQVYDLYLLAYRDVKTAEAGRDRWLEAYVESECAKGRSQRYDS